MIEVWEYVRTEQGYIARLESIYHDMYSFDNSVQCSYGEEMPIVFEKDLDLITKHSFNLIDLIEIGDYVNGYRVTCGHYTFNNEIEMIELDTENAGSGYGYQLPAKDIKTIVTKEQFKSMEYKVGEEDE